MWIIGGGPSALRFDLRQLAAKLVLAVNDAIFLMPEVPPAAVFSLDNTWVRRRRAFLERYAGDRYIALPTGTWPDCEGIPGVRYFEWAYEDGLSDDPSRLNTGGNSGYAAINLAYLKGATTIHLVGYDMAPGGPQDVFYSTWAPMFRTMVPQLKQAGVTVWNHNIHSHIDAFPRIEEL